MALKIDMSVPQMSELEERKDEKEILRISRSAQKIVSEPAFGYVLNEVGQDLVLRILDPATEDYEANLVRRLAIRLSEFKQRMELYSQKESNIMEPQSVDELINK
jgi:hypothetical protein